MKAQENMLAAACDAANSEQEPKTPFLWNGAHHIGAQHQLPRRMLLQLCHREFAFSDQ